MIWLRSSSLSCTYFKTTLQFEITKFGSPVHTKSVAARVLRLIKKCYPMPTKICLMPLSYGMRAVNGTEREPEPTLPIEAA